jgi:hypothetical protein
MEDLETIKKAISATLKYDRVSDYGLINAFLIENRNTIPKEDFNQLHKLLLQFSNNSNIMAIRIIYQKYVK